MKLNATINEHRNVKSGRLAPQLQLQTFQITHFLQVSLADAVNARAAFFYGLPVSGSRTQSTVWIRFLGCCVTSVLRPGRRGSTSISCCLNCFRFWTDSAIISIANLSRNYRRRSGWPLSKSGLQQKQAGSIVFCNLEKILLEYHRQVRRDLRCQE